MNVPTAAVTRRMIPFQLQWVLTNVRRWAQREKATHSLEDAIKKYQQRGGTCDSLSTNACNQRIGLEVQWTAWGAVGYEEQWLDAF